MQSKTWHLTNQCFRSFWVLKSPWGAPTNKDLSSMKHASTVGPRTRRGGGGSVQRAGDLRVLGLQLWEQLQVLGLQHLGDERQLWLRIASDGRGSSLSALATKFRAMWGAWPWLRWELASFFFEHPKSSIACSNLGQIWIVGGWSLAVPYLTLWRVSGFQ